MEISKKESFIFIRQSFETQKEGICGKAKLAFEGTTDNIYDEYICPWADITIHKNFKRICKKAGVEPCRFHDLRHFMASEGHALGIPNKYLMKRMGHKTENMLQNVYQHTISDVADEFDALIDEKMEKLYNG